MANVCQSTPNNLLSFYLKHKRIVNWCIILLTFFVGFALAFFIITPKMSNEKLVICEEIAHNVHSQMLGNYEAYEIPKGYKVHIFDDKIEIRPSGWAFSSVIGSVINNEFITEHSFIFAIYLSTLVSLALCCLVFLFLLLHSNGEPIL